jgi:hypothetical protein
MGFWGSGNIDKSGIIHLSERGYHYSFNQSYQENELSSLQQSR